MNVTCMDRVLPVRWWHPDKGPPLTGNHLAFDTETHLIENRYTVPDSVLLQVCNGSAVDLVWWEFIDEYFTWLTELNPEATFYAHNWPFDAEVIGIDKVWRIVDSNRAVDTGIRYQLYVLATTGALVDKKYPSLEFLAKVVLGKKIKKEEGVRLTFRREKKPTEEQLIYAAEDAAVTWFIGTKLPPMPTEDIQIKGMLALNDISLNGMLVDMCKFEEQADKWLSKMNSAESVLKSYGIATRTSKELNGAEMRYQAALEYGIDLMEESEGKKKINLSVDCLLRLVNWLVLNIEKNKEELTKELVDIYSKNRDTKLQKATKVSLLEGIEEKLGIHFRRTKDDSPRADKKQLSHFFYHLTALLGEPPDKRIELFLDKYEEENEFLPDPNARKQRDVLFDLMSDIEKAHGITLPRTAEGNYALNEEALSDIPASVFEGTFLGSYKEFKHAEKILGTYLNRSLISADGRVHPRFHYLMRTGRTSCTSPNLQNVPKEPGIREIYRAPEGWVLVSIDYSQLELCTLSQHCLRAYGESRMADIINAGIDVHGWFACFMLNLLDEKQIELDPEDKETVDRTQKMIKELKGSGDKVFKEKRALAKVADFGYPGGLGAETFIAYARGYGLSLDKETAKTTKRVWMQAFPEMERHLSPPATHDQYGNEIYVVDTFTGRRRYGCTYTACCNTKFQGPAADGAKLALWEVRKRGYKTVNFVHDELIVELPYDRLLTPRIEQIKKLMEMSMRKVVTDVRISTEAAVMIWWSKEAEEVKDERGNYLIWKPEKSKI